MTKSQVAFEMSCERFFKKNRDVYYWTLTFQEPYDYWRYLPKWHYLQKQLCGQGEYNRSGLYPGLQGIRVTEVHPGSERWLSETETVQLSHGLHFHLLVNQRIDIQDFHRIGEPIGLGFVWVSKVRNKQATARYLMKYLGKSGPQLLPGMRRWNTFGGFQGVKKNNLKIESVFHDNMARAFKGHQTEYNLFFLVKQITEIYGRWEAWPVVYRQMVTPCYTPEGDSMKRRTKLARQFIQCPYNGGAPHIDHIVFWSCNDAQGFAKNNRLGLIKCEMCAKCGAIHGRFADVVEVKLGIDPILRPNLQYIGNHRLKELEEKHGKRKES